MSVPSPGRPLRGFASDNNAGVLPEVLAALAEANRGHVVAYGDDPWTERATELFRTTFGAAASPFFVFGGTGANVVALAAALRPYEAVICAESAHLAVDECGAPERIVGCKLLTVPTADGKLTVPAIRARLAGRGDVHHTQPRLVTISQSTELGTLYTVDEIREITDFAHGRGLLVHLDGARLPVAAAALDLPLGAFGGDAGIDLLSFGGTKSGLLYGEALVAFDPALAAAIPFARKQTTQLPSKMRFIAAQLSALLTNDLWRRGARQANAMARRLAAALAEVPGVAVARPPAANAVFVTLPRPLIAPLRQRYFFYLWDEARGLARLMTSFDSTEADVDGFVAALRELVGGGAAAAAAARPRP